MRVYWTTLTPSASIMSPNFPTSFSRELVDWAMNHERPGVQHCAKTSRPRQCKDQCDFLL